MSRGYGGQVSQWDQDLSNDFPYFHKPGCWAVSPYMYSGGNTALAVLDRVHYVPFLAKGTQSVTDVSINIAGAGGTTFRMGIYSVDKDLYPSQLLAQATVDASTTGQKTAAIGPVTVRGLFFVGGVLQGTTCSYAASFWGVNSISYQTGTPNNAFNGPELWTGSVSGSMSSNPSVTLENANNNRMPRIFVKFA